MVSPSLLFSITVFRTCKEYASKGAWHSLCNTESNKTARNDYLDKVDPAAAQRVRQRYGCFQRYGYATSTGIETCEDEVVEQLIDLRYRPQSERISHYFTAHLSDQFDAVIHFDETRAVAPLLRNPEWEPEGMSDTYPHGV